MSSNPTCDLQFSAEFGVYLQNPALNRWDMLPGYMLYSLLLFLCVDAKESFLGRWNPDLGPTTCIAQLITKLQNNLCHNIPTSLLDFHMTKLWIQWICLTDPSTTAEVNGWYFQQESPDIIQIYQNIKHCFLESQLPWTQCVLTMAGDRTERSCPASSGGTLL